MPELRDFNREITVIKRDGREQRFSKAKLLRVCRWACDGDEHMVNELIDDTAIKIKDRIRTQTLVKSLIQTAANKISLIYPQWQYVAARLLLLDRYHATFPDVAFQDGEYPGLAKVFSKRIYNPELLGAYDDDELEYLNGCLDQKRDLLFTFSGLYYMLNKYVKGSESPQHTYMRVAMALHRKAPKEVRVKKVCELYDALSLHNITLATPVVINAGMQKEQMSSCILMKTDDSLESIMEVAFDEAMYSKHAGGIAIDITALRAKGARIAGNNGISSGPVGFVKIYESVIRNVAQSGVRIGSAVVTFDWWHPDVLEMVSLKRNDGVEDNRARHLKYTIRLNDTLFKAVDAGEKVKLVDPVSCPELVEAWGDEWKRLYEEAPAAKWVDAKELMFEILKTRVETGNLYVFFTDNVNQQNRISDRFINSSNLCMEIVEPSRPSGGQFSKAYRDYDTGEPLEVIERRPQEISLCTLGSIDVAKFARLDEDEQMRWARVIVEALDNTFDIAHYPVKGAEIASKNYRYIGVGIFNYAKMLAEHQVTFSDPDSLDVARGVMDQWANALEAASVSLAAERGPYPAWKPEHGPERRNALVRAIAPTASSGRVVNATESTEPVKEWFTRLDATINVPYVVPDFKKLNRWYEKAFECDQRMLIEHAAMRQEFLDQSQSVNMYVSGELAESARAFFELHKLALDKGLKTLYYVHALKNGEEEVCESCT